MKLSLSLVSSCALALFVSSSNALAQDVRQKSTVPAKSGASPADGTAPLPVKYVGPPTTADITPGDLMTRLYKFADDSLMGRNAGTIWNDKGTDYIAGELKRLGLKPAGENGTYFQQVMVFRSLDESATLSVDGKAYAAWKEFVPRDQGRNAKPFDGATAVWGGVYGDTSNILRAADAEGKIVVMRVGNGPDGKPKFDLINRQQLTLRYRNAAAIAVIAVDYIPPAYLEQVYRTPALGTRASAGDNSPVVPAYFYITEDIANAMLGTSTTGVKAGTTGKVVRGSMPFKEASAPGRNVIAVLPGSDPKLRNEYVAVGAHNDHVGFNNEPADHDSIKAVQRIARPQGADSPEDSLTDVQKVAVKALLDSMRTTHTARQDSIYNGADDDGSGSMGVLEIAEKFALAKNRPKRSMLFIWHVGEEEGMLGSGYFTDNPTIPRESIVAELNVDMIGRGGANDITGATKEGALLHGGPGYVQLVGSRRNSTELGDLLEKLNKAQNHGLLFDYSMDANGHPQNIYCRSDHYEYARYGIPIAFFTTGGHADYHQVTDEPQYIEYRNFAKVTNFIHATALELANMDHRPVLDKPKPDPKGLCRQ